MITKVNDSRVVVFSVKLYSMLLTSYPQPFHHEYAPHMLQTFGDYTRRVYAKKGVLGLFGWWGITLIDLANSLVEEHLQRITDMTKEKFIQLGGWAWMLAGIAMVAAFGIGGLYETPFGRSQTYEAVQALLWLSVSLLFGLGFAALRTKLMDSLGTLGNLSLLGGTLFGVLSFAGVLFATFQQIEDVAWYSLIGGLLAFSIALLLFGLETVNKQLLSKWNAIPVIAGGPFVVVLLFGLVFEPSGNSQAVTAFFEGFLFPASTFLLAGGVFLLGLIVHNERVKALQ